MRTAGSARARIAEYVATTPPIKPTNTISTLNIFSTNDAFLQITTRHEIEFFAST